MFEIEAENPCACGCGVGSVTPAGKNQKDDFIILEKLGFKHHVFVTMGSDQPSNKAVGGHCQGVLPESRCETR